MGFSIVPHLWLLEKVTTDCVKCPQFHTCGQYAMVAPVERRAATPLDVVRTIPLTNVPAAEQSQPPAAALASAGCA
jgi:hypothetical protein